MAPVSFKNSLVMTLIAEPRSFKSVRSLVPASVEVAVYPTSVVDETVKGLSSMISSFFCWLLGANCPRTFGIVITRMPERQKSGWVFMNQRRGFGYVAISVWIDCKAA